MSRAIASCSLWFALRRTHSSPFFFLLLRFLPSTPLFFFNDTATTEIYTLSLHDALPICWWRRVAKALSSRTSTATDFWISTLDRKSTRLNSSHQIISYAVFCLKKKKQKFTTSLIWD